MIRPNCKNLEYKIIKSIKFCIFVIYLKDKFNLDMKNEPYSFTNNKFNSLAEVLQDTHWSSCLNVLEGLSRMTYRSFCIIDYTNNKFLYVSDNTKSFCGRSSDDIIRMGQNFYYEAVPVSDLEILQTARSAAYQFLENIPDVEKCDYILSYDFHIKHAVTQSESLINHQFTPLKVDATGRVKLAICLTSMSPHASAGVIEIMHENKQDHWVYDMSNKYWRKKPKIILKKEEKEVIMLSAQGYSISEMAEYMNKSFDTIKFYRKSLFRKLEVENITEAVSHAVTKRLL